MQNLKLSTLLIGAFASVIGVLVAVSTASAATTGIVTTTVTATQVSVSVSDGAVSYGTLSVSTSANTNASGLNDSQTATNDGNVVEDFNIKGQNSAGWTLAGAAGADQYVHSFCRNDTGDCDGTPVWTALTTNYATLDTAVAASGTQVFDLKIDMPTSSSTFTQQSVDVTVQAVEN